MAVLNLFPQPNMIYVVHGCTGDYSDSENWAVCAYRSKEKAEKHVSKAMHRAMELHKGRKTRYSEPAPGSNEFDPNMQMQITGTEYYIVSTELRD